MYRFKVEGMFKNDPRLFRRKVCQALKTIEQRYINVSHNAGSNGDEGEFFPAFAQAYSRYCEWSMSTQNVATNARRRNEIMRNVINGTLGGQPSFHSQSATNPRPPNPTRLGANSAQRVQNPIGPVANVNYQENGGIYTEVPQHNGQRREAHYDALPAFTRNYTPPGIRPSGLLSQNIFAPNTQTSIRRTRNEDIVSSMQHLRGNLEDRVNGMLGLALASVNGSGNRQSVEMVEQRSRANQNEYVLNVPNSEGFRNLAEMRNGPDFNGNTRIGNMIEETLVQMLSTTQNAYRRLDQEETMLNRVRMEQIERAFRNQINQEQREANESP